MICCFGICIPYSALLPLLLVLLRPIWDFICSVLGIENHLDKKKGGAECSGGVCELKGGAKATEGEGEGKGEVECCGGLAAAAEVDENLHSAPVVAAPMRAIPEEPFDLNAQIAWKDLLASSFKKPLFVRFTASWCKPCKAIEPQFLELGSSRRGSATFVSIDVDEFPDHMTEYSVIGIPHFLVIRDGTVKGSYRGSDGGEMKAFVERSTA